MKDLTLNEILDHAFERARDLDAPLAARLESFADSLRIASPAFADAVERLISRLQQCGSGATAPKVGEPLPPFILPDSASHLVSLEDVVARGPAAISFHRGHWCPYCRINTNALAQAYCEVEPLGGQIIAITPDLAHFSMALKTEAKAKPFPILTDVDNGYALSLGLAIYVGDLLKKLMRSALIDVSTYQGNDAWFLPIPATFIVGRDGVILERFVDPDYRKRMAIEDIVEALKAAV